MSSKLWWNGSSHIQSVFCGTGIVLGTLMCFILFHQLHHPVTYWQGLVLHLLCLPSCLLCTLSHLLCTSWTRILCQWEAQAGDERVEGREGVLFTLLLGASCPGSTLTAVFLYWRPFAVASSLPIILWCRDPLLSFQHQGGRKAEAAKAPCSGSTGTLSQC